MDLCYLMNYFLDCNAWLIWRPTVVLGLSSLFASPFLPPCFPTSICEPLLIIKPPRAVRLSACWLSVRLSGLSFIGVVVWVEISFFENLWSGLVLTNFSFWSFGLSASLPVGKGSGILVCLWRYWNKKHKLFNKGKKLLMNFADWTS